MKCPLCHTEMKPSLHGVGYWYCGCKPDASLEWDASALEEEKKRWYENAKMAMKKKVEEQERP